MQLPPDFWTTHSSFGTAGIIVGGIAGLFLAFYLFPGPAPNLPQPGVFGVNRGRTSLVVGAGVIAGGVIGEFVGLFWRTYF